MLVRLHEGESPDLLRNCLIEVFCSISYNEVVEVEQELIDNAILSEEEILEFCDLHTAVLDGSIDLEGAKEVPAGHPVDTELDATILREFIDHIEVSHADRKSRTREITIVYNFIGAFDFSH